MRKIVFEGCCVIIVSAALAAGSRALAMPAASFVPGVEVTKKLAGTTILIPLAPEPAARRCLAAYGETQKCSNACADQGTGVTGCTVKTIAGQLTEVCTCGDPGLYTKRMK